MAPTSSQNTERRHIEISQFSWLTVENPKDIYNNNKNGWKKHIWESGSGECLQFSSLNDQKYKSTIKIVDG